MRFYILAMLCALAFPAQAQQLQLDRTNPANTTAGQLSFLGAVVVPSGAQRVGGLSALHVDEDGKSVTALSDAGRVFGAQLNWSPAGRLIGANFNRGQKLVDENGRPVEGRARFDAEGLAALKDGGWLVSFERDHRIERYTDWGHAPVPLPQPPGVANKPRNEGLEGVTELVDGRLFTIAESPNTDGSHQAWLYKDGAWTTLTYQAASGLHPVDLALLPGGDVVVLERGFNLFFGFRSRIARIAAADLVAGRAVAAATLAWFESPLLTENFEGLAIFPSKTPESVRLLMVSDNNFNTAQQTILAAFELNLARPAANTPSE